MFKYTDQLTLLLIVQKWEATLTRIENLERQLSELETLISPIVSELKLRGKRDPDMDFFHQLQYAAKQKADVNARKNAD